jgi:hypothetical protein
MMAPFDFRPRTRVLFREGEFTRIGEIAREFGGARCLLVADPGMVAAGYAQERFVRWRRGGSLRRRVGMADEALGFAASVEARGGFVRRWS